MHASECAARTIYILSGPVRSGKTTFLMNRLTGKSHVAGIVTPDHDGIRCLYNIRTRETLGFEIKGDAADGNDCLRIGRFCFSRSGIEKGKRILAEALVCTPRLLVIDEIGRLELNDEGFGPIVREILDAHRTHAFAGEVLLVVRETLLEKVIGRFGIMACRVFSVGDKSLSDIVCI